MGVFKLKFNKKIAKAVGRIKVSDLIVHSVVRIHRTGQLKRSPSFELGKLLKDFVYHALGRQVESACAYILHVI